MAKKPSGPATEPKIPKKFDLEVEAGSNFAWDDITYGGWETKGPVYPATDPYAAREIDQMLRTDGKAECLFQVMTLPTRRAKWSIKGGRGDQGQAEFLEEYLRLPASEGGMSVPWEMVLAQAMMARAYRMTYFEKVLKLNPDGKIVYGKLAYRPPSTTVIRRDPITGAFRGMRQEWPIRLGLSGQHKNTEPVDFEPYQCWVHINGAHRDPMNGYSDLSVVYANHITKQKIRFLWDTFLETLSMPRTVVQAKDQSAAQASAKKVAKLKGGGVAALTDDTTLDTLESGSSAAANFQEALTWLDSQSSMSVLAGFTDLTGAASSGKGSGSYALSKDQSDFFLMTSQAFADELAASISSYVLPDLIRYNYGLDASCPKFEFDPLSEDDLEPVMSLVQSLSIAPDMNVPFEFLASLVQKLSGYLNMDQAEIEAALVKAGDEFEEKAQLKKETAQQGIEAQRIGAQVNAATGLVRQAQARETEVRARLGGKTADRVEKDREREKTAKQKQRELAKQAAAKKPRVGR